MSDSSDQKKSTPSLRPIPVSALRNFQAPLPQPPVKTMAVPQGMGKASVGAARPPVAIKVQPRAPLAAIPVRQPTPVAAKPVASSVPVPTASRPAVAAAIPVPVRAATPVVPRVVPRVIPVAVTRPAGPAAVPVGVLTPRPAGIPLVAARITAIPIPSVASRPASAFPGDDDGDGPDDDGPGDWDETDDGPPDIDEDGPDFDGDDAPDEGDQPKFVARTRALPIAELMAPPDEISGRVTRLRVLESGWGFGTLQTPSGEKLNIKGELLAEMNEGESYKIKAKKTSHPKHGDGYDVVSYEKQVSADVRGLVNFIAKSYSGIGEKTAFKLVKRVEESKGQEGLEDLAQLLVERPWDLDFSAVKTGNFTYEPTHEDLAKLVEEAAARQFHLKIGGTSGVRTSAVSLLAATIARSLKNEGVEVDPEFPRKCWEAFSRNPYAPMKNVPGYGFATADAVALSVVGVEKDSDFRIAAIAAYAVECATADTGSVCVDASELIKAIDMLDATIDKSKAIQLAILEGVIACEEDADDHRRKLYYPPKLLDAEKSLAEILADMGANKQSLLGRPEELTSAQMGRLRVLMQEKAMATIPAFENGLSESQLTSLCRLIASPCPVKVLTGGPGTGKSTLLQVLVKAFEDQSGRHLDFRFAAPTGKAAKVVKGKLDQIESDHESSTIHSVLQGGGRGSFEYGRNNRLSADILVVDESSMNDIEVTASLVEALKDGAHIIFVGDPDQLPSVSPGRVLADLIELGKEGLVEHCALTETHRNGGDLLAFIKSVATGNASCADSESVSFSHKLGEAEVNFDEVMEDYLDMVRESGIEQVAFLLAHRQGKGDVAGWNVEYANRRIRERVNPDGEAVGSTSYRVNDRVLIRKNKKTEDAQRVVNGDTGTLVSFETKANGNGVKTIQVRLDDGREVCISGDEFEEMDLAYALSVHASQGSEFKDVMFVCPRASKGFANRPILYTAASRAKRRLHVYGDDVEIRRMSSMDPLPRRSGLVGRVRALRQQMAETDGPQADVDGDGDVALDRPSAG